MPLIPDDVAQAKRVRYRDVLLSLPEHHRDTIIAWARDLAERVPGLGRPGEVERYGRVVWEIVAQALLYHIDEELEEETNR